MATLHLRNVPDELHERLRGVAKRERRSVNAEAVDLLVKALDQEERAPVAELLLKAKEIRTGTPTRRGRSSSLQALHTGRRERER